VSSPALTRLWRFAAGRGLDCGVFGVGSYFSFFAPRAGTTPLDYLYQSRWAGAILLAAWAAQGVGAWLKRAPLHERLSQAPAVPEAESLAQRLTGHLFLFVGWHMILSGMIFFAGVVNLVPEMQAFDHLTRWWTPVLILLAVAVSQIPPFLVWNAVANPEPTAPAWRRGPGAEFAADQLLSLSYLVLATTILGNPAMLQGTRPINPETVAGWAVTLLLLVPLLCVVMIWLFVPFRLLLMIEELGTWRSRLFLLASLSPLMTKYIVG
jgi:hypothetical protein